MLLHAQTGLTKPPYLAWVPEARREWLLRARYVVISVAVVWGGTQPSGN